MSKPNTGTPSTPDLTMDLRLIPEFDGTSQGVTEWLDKVELVCQLRGLSELHNIVPLRLTGGAFAVYQQLSTADKLVYTKIKGALVSAFASDRFCAYEQFITRRLGDGESVDVYLADLRRLAVLFGGMPDTSLACAFVAGLPEAARRTLRASSRIESMDIDQILSRARAVLVEEGNSGAIGAGIVPRCACAGKEIEAVAVTCHSCGQPNHYARDCLTRREGRSRRNSIRCFRCGRQGHVASSCQGNAIREAVSAPPSSPAHQ